MARLPGVRANVIPDPTGQPFPRASLAVDAAKAGMDATALARALESGTPSIRVMAHELVQGRLIFELVPLTDAEIETILTRLEDILRR